MAAFLLGPIFAPPSGLLISGAVNAWASNISTALNRVLQHGNSIFGDFEANTSSISITALSTEDSEDAPFFDFHYSSPFLNHSAGGTDQVTKNSVYRIASISKLFTVYTLLVGYGWKHWDDSVTRYVPELRDAAMSRPHDPIEDAFWDQITVGALASQLSGIGRDYANGDLASQPFPWTELGLPELPPEDIPDCAGNSSLPPCNRSEYFQGLIQRHPVFAPQTTPVYSNAAFRILGYVLEAMGGKSYSTLLQSTVLDPLRLSDTSATFPTGRGSWVIPNGNESRFHDDIGDEAPTGGIYSSTDNMARLGRNILIHKQLSALDTRRWMKPGSHTSSMFASVGSPWEIWRTRTQTTRGRVIDLYTKSGSLGQYNSQLFLAPDYGVVVSILGAGSSSSTTVTITTEMVLQSLIPILEDLAREQACKSLCGTYESTQHGLNSSITIAVDADGLYVERWINRGVDVKAVASAYSVETGGIPVKAVRFQATNLQESSSASHTARGARRVAYRAIFDTTDQDTNGPARIMDPNSNSWGQFDANVYGEIAVDDFVVHLDANGTAVMIEPRVTRDTLLRSSPISHTTSLYEQGL
ncbi:beta-lactamase/transpeptidase-like protein [Xylariaceae sp. AK1471]|nr:beta-lactamase/transpeptidase-like protein [Xylariaceae sp. AK1471]